MVFSIGQAGGVLAFRSLVLVHIAALSYVQGLKAVYESEQSEVKSISARKLFLTLFLKSLFHSNAMSQRKIIFPKLQLIFIDI